MIIWSGWGLLVPGCAFVGLIAGNLLAAIVLAPTGLPDKFGMALGFGLAAPFAAIAIVYAARWVEARPPKVLVDPNTDERFEIPVEVGSFMCVATRAWALLLPLILVGVAIAKLF
jgi:hypothetical protein